MQYPESIPFYVGGFNESDFTLLCAVERSLHLQGIGWKEFGSVISASGPAVCLMRVVNRQDLDLFRKARIEHPGHSWGVCIDAANRELLAHLLFRDSFVVLLYPLVKAEISVAVQKLVQGYYMGRIRDSLCSGLRVLHQCYRWKTGYIEIPAVAEHLSIQLDMAGFCDQSSTRSMVNLALEEALVNAVEHGNLELDSKEKDKDVLGQEYERLRHQRLAQAVFAEREIVVDLSIDRDAAFLKISNEGPGFDYEARLEALSRKTGCFGDVASGKGLFLIGRVFKSLAFSSEGKTLTLVLSKRSGEGAEDTQ